MNIKAMMKQAQQMQSDLNVKKEEFAKKEFKIEKQGVTLLIMGNRKVKSIDINEALIDPEDKDIIEDLMVIAFNEAMELINEQEDALTPKVPAGMGF